MKKILIVLLIVLIVIVGAGMAKDSIAKSAVEGVAHAVTGLKLKMRSLNIGLLNSRIQISGLRLHNPSTFKDRVMFDIPEIYVDYELAALFKKQAHLEEVRLNLRELTIVKNAQGVTNLSALKPQEGPAQQQTAQQPKEEAKPGAAKGEPMAVRIDKLNLKIGQVVYKDYSAGGEPAVSTYPVNLDETYTNITDVRALAPLIVSKAVMNTALSGVMNADVKALASQFGGAGVDLGQAGLEKFAALGAAASPKAQEFLSKAKEALGESGSTVGEKTNEALEGMKSFFGGLSKPASESK